MPAAQLILTGGNLITLDRTRPRASALAVRDGRLMVVGDDAAVRALAGPDTRHIDLAGRTVTPGFIDSHLHLLWYGLQLERQADLVGSASVDEVLSRLSARSRRSEGWIQGHGFDQEKLTERAFPTRAQLDKVSASRPIIISRICGHAVVVNSAALALITPEQRAAGDESTGLYTEGDSAPFYAQIPQADESEMESAALAACAVALRSGITGVQTMLDSPAQMVPYARIRRRTGRLPIRITGMPPYRAVEQLHAHGVNTTFGDEWLRFGAAKLFSDGSLGAHTALLAEPYADKPNTTGIRIHDPADLSKKAADAQAKGFQLAIHAIGDQALRETIAAIRFALGDADNRTHRHRIEHASFCPPDCIEMLAEKKIVVTLQPQFVTSDTWTAARLGTERARWAYPFRTMIAAGIPVSLSSDCPVERLDASACLASAVGRHPLLANNEHLTVEQALYAYCLGSAHAAHAEDRVGSLEAGKFADFNIFAKDPTTLDSIALAELRPQQVFVGGAASPAP